MRARVTAAYATCKLSNPVTGGFGIGGFYREAILPDSADPDNVAALVRRGYAEWLDGPKAEKPSSEPAAEPKSAEPEKADEEPEGPERPAGNASQAAWAEYAVATGADREAVEAMTRDELRAEYGG